jgi:hypothetical protein
MPTPNQQRRRALELLEASIDGCTQAIMLAYGFKTELLVELVNAEFATATIERMVIGGRGVKVVRMRIPPSPGGVPQPTLRLFRRGLFFAPSDKTRRGVRRNSRASDSQAPSGHIRLRYIGSSTPPWVWRPAWHGQKSRASRGWESLRRSAGFSPAQPDQRRSARWGPQSV